MTASARQMRLLSSMSAVEVDPPYTPESSLVDDERIWAIYHYMAVKTPP